MTLERRAAFELRASDDKSPKLTGYAAVFDSPSADLGGFTEIVKPGAFTRTLASGQDVLALVQHLPHLVLGRRSAGTLRLNEDHRGLAFEIDPPQTQAAQDLMVSVKRGDIKGASFAFNVPAGGDHWDSRSTGVVRELRDLNLFECTITASPAYQDTSVALRSFNIQFLPRGVRIVRRYLETV